jgi:hypothetical protein
MIQHCDAQAACCLVESLLLHPQNQRHELCAWTCGSPLWARAAAMSQARQSSSPQSCGARAPYAPECASFPCPAPTPAASPGFLQQPPRLLDPPSLFSRHPPDQAPCTPLMVLHGSWTCSKWALLEGCQCKSHRTEMLSRVKSGAHRVSGALLPSVWAPCVTQVLLGAAAHPRLPGSASCRSVIHDRHRRAVTAMPPANAIPRFHA